MGSNSIAAKAYKHVHQQLVMQLVVMLLGGVVVKSTLAESDSIVTIY